jgi:hypothetical protein
MRICTFLMVVCVGAVDLCTQAEAKIESGPRLSIGVVVDTHPQQAAVLSFERHVVEALVSRLAGAEADGFVITYSNRIQTIADWSPLESWPIAAVPHISLDHSADGSAARGADLNDGLMAGVAKLGASSTGDLKGLIVIGEGNDGGSAATFSQLLAAAKRQHVQCFALLVANHRSQVGRVRQFGFDLFRLTSGTHGKTYDVRTDPHLLDKALEDVFKRLQASSLRS